MTERILLSPGGATEAKQDGLLAALGDVATADSVRELLLRIHAAVDGLELSADTVNLAVDGVESLLTDIKAKATELDAAFDAEDFAQDATVTSFLTANHDDLVAVTNAIAALQSAAGDDNTALLAKLDEVVAGQQSNAVTRAELDAAPLDVTITSGGQTDALTRSELDAAVVKVDDDASQTILSAISAAQLPDGHGVTVGNFPATFPDGHAQPLTRAELDANPVTANSDIFTRTLKFEPVAGEEIRRSSTPTFDYHGIAPDGSATSALVWSVVRFTKTAGKITRVQFRSGMSWDDQALGWT